MYHSLVNFYCNDSFNELKKHNLIKFLILFLTPTAIYWGCYEAQKKIFNKQNEETSLLFSFAAGACAGSVISKTKSRVNGNYQLVVSIIITLLIFLNYRLQVQLHYHLMS